MKKTVFLASAILLLISRVSPALAGPTNPNFAIPDGEWEGSMQAAYDWAVVDVTGTWYIKGPMHFMSVAGELNGDAELTGTVSAERPDTYAIGSMDAAVKILGSSFAPEFQLTGGEMDITANVSGFTGEMKFPLEAGEAVPIKLTSVTCSLAVGDWDDWANQNFKSLNVSTGGLLTAWAATRVGDLSSPSETQTHYQDRLDALMEQANEFQWNTKKNQSLDPNALQSLLTNAEEIVAALRKNNDCGFTSPWQFLLPVATVIANVINFAYNNPGYFSNYDVFLLTQAAIETGVIGSGAVNPQLDADMKSKLGALIGVKLDDLEAAPGFNCQDLITLAIAANWIGGPAQTQATGLAADNGC